MENVAKESREAKAARLDELRLTLEDRIAAYAAGLGLPGEEKEIVRTAAEILTVYEFRLRAGEEHERRTGSAFSGKLIRSKFATACRVCRKGIAEGADVLWAKGGGVAHPACGEVAP